MPVVVDFYSKYSIWLFRLTSGSFEVFLIMFISPDHSFKVNHLMRQLLTHESVFIT